MNTRTLGSAFATQLAERIDTHRERARELVRSLSHEELHGKPAEGGWSVAECLQHLSVTARIHARRMDAVLNAAIMTGKRKPGCDFQPDAFSRKIIAAVGPNAKKRYRAPHEFSGKHPESGRGGWLILAEFDAAGESLRVCLHRGSWLDLARFSVRPPSLPWLKLSVGSMLLALLAHEERHLQQAEAAARSVRALASTAG